MVKDWRPDHGYGLDWSCKFPVLIGCSLVWSWSFSSLVTGLTNTRKQRIGIGSLKIYLRNLRTSLTGLSVPSFFSCPSKITNFLHVFHRSSFSFTCTFNAFSSYWLWLSWNNLYGKNTSINGDSVMPTPWGLLIIFLQIMVCQSVSLSEWLVQMFI